MKYEICYSSYFFTRSFDLKGIVELEIFGEEERIGFLKYQSMESSENQIH